MTNSTKRLRNEAGFSLIEMMVSLILMTILFGVAVPAMSRYMRTHEVLGAANNLAADLRLCRQRAVAESNNWIFSWDLGAGTYRMHDDDDNNGAEDAGERIEEKTLDSDVTLDNGATAFVDGAVTFLPSGAASQNGQLKVSGADGLERTIQLIRPTGLVKVLS
jgi:prepilin-type N-terminal cleavage/methylation domain-containing protein